MAITTSKRPPEKLIPSAADASPARNSSTP
jgi:hypothetical protein